jgi:hypothetical protein
MPNPTTNRGYVLPTVGDPETEWPAELQAAFDAIDADMAIVTVTGTGFPARTAPDTWALRSLAVGEGLSITNPAGVGGNPTIALEFPRQYVLTSGDSAPITASAMTTFNKSFTLPAAILNAVGTVVRVRAGGIQTNVAAKVLDLAIRVGGQIIMNRARQTDGFTNGGWYAVGEAIVRTTGTSGTLQPGSGNMDFVLAGGPEGTNNAVGLVTLDLTAALVVDLQAGWTSGGVTAETITVRSMVIDIGRAVGTF